MKKSAIEQIEKEIDEKTKLPQKIKDKIKKEVFTNILVAGVIIVYFILIVLGSVGSVKNVRSIDLNIFSLIFLGVAIFLFEIAYRKDDGKLAMYGIETLVVAVFTLFLPYIIFELNESDKKYYLIASIYIAVYYIFKSIAISLKTRNKYMNSNISDVKEIIKKEKSKKRIKEELVDEIEETKIAKQPKSAERNVGGNTASSDLKPKKRSNTKKTEQKEVIAKKINTEKEEVTPKRRGRPRKSENKVLEETTNTPQPKKRGRPRKVVTNSND